LTVALLARSGPADAAGADRADANLLADAVRECARSGIARRALLLRLSGLPQTLRRPQHLRLARAALEPLAQVDRARIFTLPGDDLAVIWRGEAENAVASVIGALARLFEGEDTPAVVAPWDLFLLPAQGDMLLSAIQPPAPPAPVSSPARTPPRRLDVAALTALETALATVDVTSFVRRRRIYAAGADGMFRLKWEQRHLSIGDLGETLTPDRSLQADPWLYRRLTRTLDQRMLALLTVPQELRDARPFSLALNVASMLSPAFLRFDAALPTILRGHVMIEMLPADVLGDLSAFVFARDFARERGYRLLLRDMNATLLPVFPLARIGIDMLQLPWSAQLADYADAGDGPLLQDPGRTLLTGTDTPQALSWGTAQGIGFFQGRMVEPG